MNMGKISIPAEEIFEVFSFPVTNTFFLTLIIGGFIFIFFHFGLKKRKILPGKWQNFSEWVLEKLLNFINSITQDRKITEEIFPIASTLFILILSVNLLGIIPGLGVFHFLRAPSSDLNFTIALALSSMIFIHIMAIKKIGFFGHFKKFFNFKSPTLLFVGGLEGFGEITKTLSLSVRLFGNLFAGEVLLITTSFLVPFFVPLPFLFLEILIGFIQALIFSTLIVIFYTTSCQIH